MRNASTIAFGALLLGAASFAGCASDKSEAATGGAAGMGTAGMGTAGVPCVGTPTPTVHNACDGIPSLKKNDAGTFIIKSDEFANCGEIPAARTCDGKEFGTGSNPALTWSGAPAGTMSFAFLFKDIGILADNDPTKDKFAYHYVMWDIPATTTGLPAALTGGYKSVEVPGAKQWAGRNNYGFFPPCPNPFPASDARFTCSLVIDSYSFSLYALPMAKLDGLPAPDLDATTGMPTGNWVVNMGHYIESLPALAVTEYRGTSKAWSTLFNPPAAVQYPCTADMITAGMTTTCLM